MYFAERVSETTTTTGTGTITLLGAVAQYQTFTSRVYTGDPVEYVILDANGTGWEVGRGTMATSSTLSRDTIYQSSNADAAITLSTGTHKVFMPFSAQGSSKRYVAGDGWIDHVVSGLVLPTTSGNLTGTLSAGQAYVVGQRVVKGAQANTYTASKDTYVDLSNIGVLTYSAVANAAAAPSLTANSIRLGYVVTGASAITSSVTTGLDSLGNVMRNVIRSPSCLLLSVATQTVATGVQQVFAFTLASEELVNNDLMHSTSTNNTRITIQHAGLYTIKGFCEYVAVSQSTNFTVLLFKNGSAVVQGQGGNYSVAGGYPCVTTAVSLYLAATDYLELKSSHGTTNTESATNYSLSVARIG